MFLELIATFIAGIGAAGVVLLLNRLTGGRLPSWFVPAAAGLAMIAFTIWSEYSWAGRTMAELPEGLEVISQGERRAAWKPWTYLAPQVDRLAVLDTGSVQTKPEAPDVRLVELYLFARWRATAVTPQLVDCAAGARADVSDVALADPGQAAWIPVGAGDPLVRLACNPPS